MEGETAPGIWTPFPSLIIEGATFFTVDTFHFERAVDLDFSGELFDENIKNKTLNSGEVVKGWIFFEQWFKSSQLRFRIVDTRGVEKSAIMNEGSKMKIDFGYGSIRALGHKTDLSNLGFAPGVNVDLINANRPKK